MIPRTSRVVKEAHVTTSEGLEHDFLCNFFFKKKEAHVATSEGLEHDVLCDCMRVVFQDCIKIQDA